VLAGSPADFGKLIADDTEKWAKVIRAAGSLQTTIRVPTEGSCRPPGTGWIARRLRAKFDVRPFHVDVGLR
jgi:hypothetical protein